MSTVLLLEDSAGDASLIRMALDRSNPGPAGSAPGLRVVWVTTLQAAINHLLQEPAVCILADLGLPDADGLAVVDALREVAGASPIVVLTGRSDDALALQAIRRGADDYVLKNDLLAVDEWSSHQLRRIVMHAVERVDSRRRAERLAARSQAVMNALGNGLLVLDAAGQVTDTNPAGEALLAALGTASRGPVTAVLRRLHTDGGDLTGRHDPVARAMLTGAPVSVDSLRLVTADGAERHIDLQVYPMLPPGGSGPADVPAHGTEGAVVALHDVTARYAAKQEERFRAALLESIGQAVVVTDAAHRVVVFNGAAEALYGWSADDVIGRPVGEVIRVHDAAEAVTELLAAHDAGATWTGDLDLVRRDGSVFPALVTSTPVFDRSGHRVANIGVAADLTQRHQAYEASRALSAIVTSSADAIFTKRLDGTVLSWNAGAERLYGYTPEEMIGRNVRLLNPDAVPEIDELTARVAQGEIVAGHEVTRRHRDGSEVAVSITISPMVDERGRVVAASVIARDIAERHRLEEALRQQAMYDALTGLPNRTLLEDRLTQLLASCERQRKPVAVLFCDLDHFKQVNDASGHLTGDKLLKEAARRLAAAVRPADTVARLGGDEFIVVCQADADQAELVARRLQEALREPIVLDGHRHHVTASIGIAVAPPLEADPATLMSQADTAMYEVKAAGRAGFRVFDPAMASHSKERLRLSNELRDAVAARALTVHYQPQFDLATQPITGFEALVRWRHATRGWIAPDRFLPLAETGGFVHELDQQVLEQACQDMGRLMRTGLLLPGSRMAVNFSAKTVTDPGMVAGVLAAAGHAGLPLTAVEIEVTETGLLDDLESACVGLGRLRTLGVDVALDDFGTGYSSLTYVRQLPVGALKIDRSFVENVVDSADDRAIAASIVALGRALDLRVVAEGIEDTDQLRLLRELGCSAAQGYLWSPAVPYEALAVLLRRAADPIIDLPQQDATPPLPELRRTRV